MDIAGNDAPERGIEIDATRSTDLRRLGDDHRKDFGWYQRVVLEWGLMYRHGRRGGCLHIRRLSLSPPSIPAT